MLQKTHFTGQELLAVFHPAWNGRECSITQRAWEPPHSKPPQSMPFSLWKCVTGRDSVSPFPSKTPPITTLRWSYEEEGQGRGEQGVLAEIKVEMLMVAKSVVRTDNPVQKSHAQLHSSTQKYQIDDSTVEQILHQVPSAPA